MSTIEIWLILNIIVFLVIAYAIGRWDGKRKAEKIYDKHKVVYRDGDNT